MSSRTEGTPENVGDIRRAGVALAELVERSRDFFDSLGLVVVILDKSGDVDYANQAAADLLGWERKDMLGKHWFNNFLPERDQGDLSEVFGELINDQLHAQMENPVVTSTGEERLINWYNTVLRDASDEAIGAMSIGEDITDRRRAEQTIARQNEEILNLSTPVLLVKKGVLVAPLIGNLDSSRTEQFTQRLLDEIMVQQAPFAIIDITGVGVVDTQTAQYLLETISATRLLGTRAILTGVSPGIAQTLVQLGIDLQGIDSRSSLAAGLHLVDEILESGAR